MERRRKAAIGLLAALTLLAAGLLGGQGSAATATKPYTANVSPGAVAGGGTRTFQVALANKAAHQTLGSANVAVPLPWGAAIVAARLTTGPLPAGSTFDGRTVFLRNLAIAPGAAKTLELDVVVPCAGGTFTWSVRAKQSNDFHGPPGNDFTLVQPSSLTTAVEGSCALRFRVQPQAALAGETITGASLDPGGPPLEVEVVDGSGQPFAGATGTVTTALESGSGLSGTLSRPLVGGVATFDDLSIATSGSYRLVASSSGYGPATSDGFRVADGGAVCPNTEPECVASASFAEQDVVARSTALNNGDTTGVTQLLITNLRVGPPAGFCAGLDDLIGPGVDLDVRPLAGLTEVRLTIPDEVRSFPTALDLAHLDVCIGTNQTFMTKNGSLAPSTVYDYDGDGDLDTRFLGLLPNCPASTPGVGASPCIVHRALVEGGAQVLFRVPLPYDPSWWNG